MHPAAPSQSPKHRRRPGEMCNHVVQFYQDDDFLVDAIGRHIGPALDTGRGAVIIATPSHRDALHRRLTSRGKDIVAARSSGRYVALDAAETLAQFMIDGWPDEERFTRVVGDRIATLSAQHGHVHAFGEMVALLHAGGKADAAIALEKLWNALASRQAFSLHCAYPLRAFSHHSQTEQLLKVCAEHSGVIPAEGFAEPMTPDAHDRTIVELQQKTLALSTEIDGHRSTTKVLQEKLEELTLADRRKNEFLAMLGHELRNPLSPILSALQILQLPGADAAAIRMARETIAHQTRHLARIVDDLLDVTRISNGKIELRNELVDLASVIGRAIDVTRSLIESKHHQVSLALPLGNVLVCGDATRLEQVFVNVLTNAAKYMAAHGRIAIRAELRGADVDVAVEDNGVGLSPEIRPRLFDLFTQDERSLDRSLGGLGIGLWMVRKLVELHRGSVDAHSDGPGMGSQFVVTLPVARASDSSAEKARVDGAPIDANAAAHRILVVDDNRDGADNLALLCRMTGYVVDVAYDGISALELASTFRPDVVLLDIGLPGRDGYEVARELRRSNTGPLHIIAMTGYGRDEDRRRSAAAGVDLHLVKPIEPAELFDLLSRPLDAMIGART